MAARQADPQALLRRRLDDGPLSDVPSRLTGRRTRPCRPPAASRRRAVAAVVLVLRAIGLARRGVTRATLSGGSSHGTRLGLSTLARVVVLIALASLIWVPIGIWIGLRPRIATWCSRWPSSWRPFPPRAVSHAVVAIVSGASPRHLAEPADGAGHAMVHPVQCDRGRQRLPHRPQGSVDDVSLADLAMVAPSHAARHPALLRHRSPDRGGGSWNASIVAEVASWGNTSSVRRVSAPTSPTQAPPATIRASCSGIAVMSSMVVACNRLLWRPLYRLAERRFRLE